MIWIYVIPVVALWFLYFRAIWLDHKLGNSFKMDKDDVLALSMTLIPLINIYILFIFIFDD